jgi:hypothetical protein
MIFLFFEVSVTGTVYLHILENFVFPQLEEEEAGVFQQDSALPPFSKFFSSCFKRKVSTLLNEGRHPYFMAS